MSPDAAGGWGSGGAPRFSVHDVIAGASVGLVLIPQSMAYADLAGLPAHYGLYASALPPIVAAFFASSPYLQTGPVALTALLTLGALVSTAIFWAGALSSGRWRLGPRELRQALALGLVNPLLYYLVLFEAYDRLPAQLAQPLQQTAQRQAVVRRAQPHAPHVAVGIVMHDAGAAGLALQLVETSLRRLAGRERADLDTVPSRHVAGRPARSTGVAQRPAPPTPRR